ncbi:MAG: DUF2935 domain-containing protein, partial [Bacillota bacterium]|nr:DUF2935 domain-containing protein [Bacillota bacterium]
NFKVQFEGLLAETIALSNGVISPEVVMSGELVTPLTSSAEQVSTFYTGIQINSRLTQAETGIAGNPGLFANPLLEQRVFNLNQRAMALTTALAQFKSTVLNNVTSCKMFTTNYPLLIDHILREAHFYLRMLTKLQRREEILTVKDLLEQEVFWNRIMAEHSKFIRGLLDPTEVNLINTADNYGKEFDKLTQEAVTAIDKTTELPKVTGESLKAATGLRDFKATGTRGFINCNIKAIAYPLLGDHVLREANHYIRILKMFNK